jgi:hypothetical protein
MCAMGVDFARFYDYTCNWILKLSYGMEMFAFFILLPKKNKASMKLTSEVVTFHSTTGSGITSEI